MSDEQEGMMCQECGERRATVHVTDFVDGKPVQTHLCEVCSSKKSGPSLLSFAQLFGVIEPELRKLSAMRCPHCGMSYLEFRQTFRFGCPGDYEAFEAPLDDLLERIHGANRHVGKVPTGAAQKGTRQLRLAVLRRKLKDVVDREDFERAAQVRDQIRSLEREGAGKA